MGIKKDLLAHRKPFVKAAHFTAPSRGDISFIKDLADAVNFARVSLEFSQLLVETAEDKKTLLKFISDVLNSLKISGEDWQLDVSEIKHDLFKVTIIFNPQN